MIQSDQSNSVTVISNEFHYKDGKTISHGNLINPTVKQARLYTHNQKQNVLLMGDILEDAKMANDTKHQNILRVGFLNQHDETRLRIF